MSVFATALRDWTVLANRHVVFAHPVRVADRTVAEGHWGLGFVSAALPGSPTVTNSRLVCPVGMVNTLAPGNAGNRQHDENHCTTTKHYSILIKNVVVPRESPTLADGGLVWRNAASGWCP